ncbi:hypothetical protein HDU97_001198 [Phlyctochytrium planicorne]|nr:hypothetical protein HDU97_001198 [Phlyctochytrium planicorne]
MIAACPAHRILFRRKLLLAPPPTVLQSTRSTHSIGFHSSHRHISIPNIRTYTSKSTSSSIWTETFKLAFATTLGIIAGCYIAIHGAATLEKYGIFTYVPDDDDDDEEDGDGDGKEDKNDDDEKQIQHNDLFGDYRLNLAFHWQGIDADTLDVVKFRVSTTLADLQKLDRDGIYLGRPKEEIALAIKYLKDHIALLDKRLKEERAKEAKLAKEVEAKRVKEEIEAKKSKK